MIDIKEQAESLRKQGMTYKQILSTLDGALSVDWLRRNISKVPKGVYIDDMMAELIALATRPQGCTNYEAQGIIYKYRSEKVTYDMVKGIKTKAKKIDKRCLFIPAWLDTTHPIESNTYMNSLASDVYENIQHAMESYMELFPDTNHYAVLREIVSLAYSENLPEPLSTRLERNSKNVEEICSRRGVGVDPNAAHFKPTGKECVQDLMDQRYLKDVDTLTDPELDAIWNKDVPY